MKLSGLIKEILKLLVNILSNRGFEQVQQNQKSMFSRFIQRTIQLTKHYRENYANEDDIISKLTQFTTIFLSNAQLKTLILGEFNKIDMIRSLLNDIQVIVAIRRYAPTKILPLNLHKVNFSTFKKISSDGTTVQNSYMN